MPEADWTASPAKPMPEVDRVTLPTQPMPEPDEAVCTDEFIPENDWTVSQWNFMSKTNWAASQETPRPYEMHQNPTWPRISIPLCPMTLVRMLSPAFPTPRKWFGSCSPIRPGIPLPGGSGPPKRQSACIESCALKGAHCRWQRHKTKSTCQPLHTTSHMITNTWTTCLTSVVSSVIICCYIHAMFLYISRLSSLCLHLCYVVVVFVHLCFILKKYSAVVSVSNQSVTLKGPV